MSPRQFRKVERLGRHMKMLRPPLLCNTPYCSIGGKLDSSIFPCTFHMLMKDNFLIYCFLCKFHTLMKEYISVNYFLCFMLFLLKIMKITLCFVN
jgi:hypothetical protein